MILDRTLDQHLRPKSIKNDERELNVWNENHRNSVMFVAYIEEKHDKSANDKKGKQIFEDKL